MIARVLSATLRGVEACLVQVEVDMVSQLPQVTTVGLAEASVKESRERVRAAITNSGFRFPARRITVNLAPADVPKTGTAFDLPIAVGILLEAGDLQPDRLGRWLLAGELSLDGRLRPVRGALPLALAARDAGLEGVILPRESSREAAVVEGLDVRAADGLAEVVAFLNGEECLDRVAPDLPRAEDWEDDVDLCDVAGHTQVKRALELAAAGGHNLLMIGPPGSGKSMLARRLPTILPSMAFEESLETTRIYSVMGLVGPHRSLIVRRPFRAPHHTISDAGLVGGGVGPSPGEVSLAHNGVLFLDELPEFRRQSLEVLRQPLEDGTVTIARAAGVVTYPARVMLVATMNPCPCGYLGDRARRCVCSSVMVDRYRGRLSGPLLDRIDLHLEVPAVGFGELRRAGDRGSVGERSAVVRARVEAARERQRRRYRGPDGAPVVHCNAQLSPRQLREVCALDAEGQALLERAIERLGLSARAYTRILKVARTLADLDDADAVAAVHVAEAVMYRVLDRGRAGAAPAPGVSTARVGDLGLFDEDPSMPDPPADDEADDPAPIAAETLPPLDAQPAGWVPA